MALQNSSGFFFSCQLVLPEGHSSKQTINTGFTFISSESANDFLYQFCSRPSSYGGKMCHLSNIQGIPTLHTGRKQLFVIKNFDAVMFPDWTMMNIWNLNHMKNAALTGILELVVSHGEMRSGLGHNSFILKTKLKPWDLCKDCSLCVLERERERDFPFQNMFVFTSLVLVKMTGRHRGWNPNLTGALATSLLRRIKLFERILA